MSCLNSHKSCSRQYRTIHSKTEMTREMVAIRYETSVVNLKSSISSQVCKIFPWPPTVHHENNENMKPNDTKNQEDSLGLPNIIYMLNIVHTVGCQWHSILYDNTFHLIS